MSGIKVNVPGLAKLPAFCHAVVAGDFIFVSGTLGTKPDSIGLALGAAVGIDAVAYKPAK